MDTPEKAALREWNAACGTINRVILELFQMAPPVVKNRWNHFVMYMLIPKPQEWTSFFVELLKRATGLPSDLSHILITNVIDPCHTYLAFEGNSNPTLQAASIERAKSAFHAVRVIYEQIERVPVASPLYAILAIMQMVEAQKNVIEATKLFARATYCDNVEEVGRLRCDHLRLCNAAAGLAVDANIRFVLATTSAANQEQTLLVDTAQLTRTRAATAELIRLSAVIEGLRSAKLS